MCESDSTCLPCCSWWCCRRWRSTAGGRRASGPSPPTVSPSWGPKLLWTGWSTPSSPASTRSPPRSTRTTQSPWPTTWPRPRRSKPLGNSRQIFEQMSDESGRRNLVYLLCDIKNIPNSNLLGFPRVLSFYIYFLYETKKNLLVSNSLHFAILKQ